MLVITILIYIILIFPIFLSLYTVYVGENNKLYFAIYICGFIKIICGYVNKIDEGFAIHITNKKAIILNKNKILNLKKSIGPLKDYHIIMANTLVEIYSTEVLPSLTTCFVINYFLNLFIEHIKNIKPYINLSSGFFIKMNNEEKINVYANGRVLLNFLMILLSVIKIGVGKLINAIKRKQNKLSYRNSIKKFKFANRCKYRYR